MGKLYSIYLSEKEKNKSEIILFKSGIFYLALDKDAFFLSTTFGFKLTNLNDTIKKCGFPCNSLDTYLKLFKSYNIGIKIIEIEKNTTYDLKRYEQNKKTLEILNLINNIDIDNLSVSEAYNFIQTIKEKTKDMYNNS